MHAGVKRTWRFHEETWNKKQKRSTYEATPCRLLFKHKFIKVIEATYHTFFGARTTSVFTEKHHTEPTQAPTVRHFETYYSSCKSFSSNYKSVQIFSTRGPKFPNLESQTWLKHLIYLPVPCQVFFISATCWAHPSCNGLIKRELVSNQTGPRLIAKLDLNEIRYN